MLRKQRNLLQRRYRVYVIVRIQKEELPGIRLLQAGQHIYNTAFPLAGKSGKTAALRNRQRYGCVI